MCYAFAACDQIKIWRHCRWLWKSFKNSIEISAFSYRESGCVCEKLIGINKKKIAQESEHSNILNNGIEKSRSSLVYCYKKRQLLYKSFIWKHQKLKNVQINERCWKMCHRFNVYFPNQGQISIVHLLILCDFIRIIEHLQWIWFYLKHWKIQKKFVAICDVIIHEFNLDFRLPIYAWSNFIN